MTSTLKNQSGNYYYQSVLDVELMTPDKLPYRAQIAKVHQAESKWMVMLDVPWGRQRTPATTQAEAMVLFHLYLRYALTRSMELK